LFLKWLWRPEPFAQFEVNFPFVFTPLKEKSQSETWFFVVIALFRKKQTKIPSRTMIIPGQV